MNTTKMKVLRSMLGITLRDKQRNVETKRKSIIKQFTELIQRDDASLK